MVVMTMVIDDADDNDDENSIGDDYTMYENIVLLMIVEITCNRDDYSANGDYGNDNNDKITINDNNDNITFNDNNNDIIINDNNDNITINDNNNHNDDNNNNQDNTAVIE